MKKFISLFIAMSFIMTLSYAKSSPPSIDHDTNGLVNGLSNLQAATILGEKNLNLQLLPDLKGVIRPNKWPIFVLCIDNIEENFEKAETEKYIKGVVVLSKYLNLTTIDEISLIDGKQINTTSDVDLLGKTKTEVLTKWLNTDYACNFSVTYKLINCYTEKYQHTNTGKPLFLTIN